MNFPPDLNEKSCQELKDELGDQIQAELAMWNQYMSDLDRLIEDIYTMLQAYRNPNHACHNATYASLYQALYDYLIRIRADALDARSDIDRLWQDWQNFQCSTGGLLEFFTLRDRLLDYLDEVRIPPEYAMDYLYLCGQQLRNTIPRGCMGEDEPPDIYGSDPLPIPACVSQKQALLDGLLRQPDGLVASVDALLERIKRLRAQCLEACAHFAARNLPDCAKYYAVTAELLDAAVEAWRSSFTPSVTAALEAINNINCTSEDYANQLLHAQGLVSGMEDYVTTFNDHLQTAVDRVNTLDGTVCALVNVPVR